MGASSLGTNSLAGYTKLCKGIAVVLAGGHIVVQILPAAVNHLALIPARMFSLKKYLLQGGARAFSSSNGTRAYVVDTHALMRRLEAEGFSSSQARAAAYTVKKVLDGTFEKIDNSFATKSQFEKIEAVQKANVGNAIFEVNTSVEQWARQMDEKFEKLQHQLDEELELAFLEAKKKLTSMEFEHASKRNDAKHHFLYFTAGTLLLLGTFSLVIVRMLK